MNIRTRQHNGLQLLVDSGTLCKLPAGTSQGQAQEIAEEINKALSNGVKLAEYIKAQGFTWVQIVKDEEGRFSVNTSLGKVFRAEQYWLVLNNDQMLEVKYNSEADESSIENYTYIEPTKTYEYAYRYSYGFDNSDFPQSKVQEFIYNKVQECYDRL